MSTNSQSLDNGESYCKYSDAVHVPYYGLGKYFGEFSVATNLVHGRGIFISKEGRIYINYFADGVDTDGKYINIAMGDGYFQVGEESTVNGTLHCKETRYFIDGTSK